MVIFVKLCLWGNADLVGGYEKSTEVSSVFVEAMSSQKKAKVKSIMLKPTSPVRRERASALL